MAAGSNKKAKLPSRSTTTINDLGSEILSEILNRISCKSIFLCKSVCKLWFNLISNPDFITHFIASQRQNQTHNHKQKLLVHSTKEHRILTPHVDGLEVSLNFLPCFEQEQGENVYIVGSCNDLFLCCESCGEKVICYICNPITKQWAVLPPRPCKPKYMGFICEPYCDIDKQGHVSIKSNFRFKVVAIPDSLKNRVFTESIQVDIFSSESGKWEESTCSATQKFVWNPRQFCLSAVVYNMRMHWPTAENTILVYDPYNNSVRCLNGPRRINTDFMVRLLLFLSRDSLWISQMLGHLLRIWQLKDYDKMQWSLEYMVDFRRMHLPRWLRPYYAKKYSSSGAIWRCRTKVMTMDPENPDTVFLNINDSLVVSCNLRKNSWKRFGDHPYHPYHCRIHPVLELLVPFWPTPIPPFPSHVCF